MNCYNCGIELEPGQIVCPNCGTYVFEVFEEKPGLSINQNHNADRPSPAKVFIVALIAVLIVAFIATLVRLGDSLDSQQNTYPTISITQSETVYDSSFASATDYYYGEV